MVTTTQKSLVKVKANVEVEKVTNTREKLDRIAEISPAMQSIKKELDVLEKSKKKKPKTRIGVKPKKVSKKHTGEKTTIKTVKKISPNPKKTKTVAKKTTVRK